MRNVLGFRGADHEETSPGASVLAVTALECSLYGQTHLVRLLAGSRIHGLYASGSSTEDFFCSYGVNPAFVGQLGASGLHVGAVDEAGDVRAVERRDHPFYFGTLFVPQSRANEGSSHPLLTAFAGAVRASNRTP